MGQASPFKPIAVVVEDDVLQRELAVVLLEGCEMGVIECESAEGALRVLEKGRPLLPISSLFLFQNVAANDLGDIGILFVACFDESGIVETVVVEFDTILRFHRLVRLRLRVGMFQRLGLLGRRHD